MSEIIQFGTFQIFFRGDGSCRLTAPYPAVKRNRGCFPHDFMFRLSAKETREVNQSQIVTGLQVHHGPR